MRIGVGGLKKLTKPHTPRLTAAAKTPQIGKKTAAPGPSATREALKRTLDDFRRGVGALEGATQRLASMKPATNRELIERETQRIEMMAARIAPREKNVQRQLVADFRSRARRVMEDGLPQSYAEILRRAPKSPIEVVMPHDQGRRVMLTGDALRQSPGGVAAIIGKMIRSGEAAKLTDLTSTGARKILAALHRSEKSSLPGKSTKAQLSQMMQEHRLIPLAVQADHNQQLKKRGEFNPHTLPPARDIRFQQMLSDPDMRVSLSIESGAGAARPSAHGGTPSAGGDTPSVSSDLPSGRSELPYGHGDLPSGRSGVASASDAPYAQGSVPEPRGTDTKSVTQISPVAMAQGGIVTGPTHTLLGEKGFMEAVVPLDPSSMASFFPPEMSSEIGGRKFNARTPSAPNRSTPPQAGAPGLASMAASTPPRAQTSASDEAPMPGRPLAGPAAARRSAEVGTSPISENASPKQLKLSGTLDLGANGMQFGEARLDNVDATMSGG
jgi:hypothetical protein